MTTTGTVIFTITRDQLITDALIECGVVDPESGSAPSAALITNAARRLNMMIKAWSAVGLQLWEKRYAAVFMQPNQGVYVLGSPGPAGDQACLSTPYGYGFVQTTGTGSGSTITLGTITNQGTAGIPAITIASGWNIGIQQTDNSFFWTTVNGAPVGNLVTLTSAPTIGNVAGGIVYAYQNKMFRPMRITDGILRQVNSPTAIASAQASDIPVMIIPREQWNRFGQKGSSGSAIQLTYDPQLNNGIIEVYPVPSTQPTILFLEVQKPIDDVTNSTDNFDVPQEWYEALMYGLALRMCTGNGVPQQKRVEIKDNAVTSYAFAAGFDQEQASVFIMPNSQMVGLGNGTSC